VSATVVGVALAQADPRPATPLQTIIGTPPTAADRAEPGGTEPTAASGRQPRAETLQALETAVNELADFPHQ